MHAAAAETGCFAGGVQAGEDPSACREHPAGEIGFEAAKVLRVRIFSFTAISGPALGSRIRCGLVVRISLSPR